MRTALHKEKTDFRTALLTADFKTNRMTIANAEDTKERLQATFDKLEEIIGLNLNIEGISYFKNPETEEEIITYNINGSISSTTIENIEPFDINILTAIEDTITTIEDIKIEKGEKDYNDS